MALIECLAVAALGLYLGFAVGSRYGKIMTVRALRRTVHGFSLAGRDLDALATHLEVLHRALSLQDYCRFQARHRFTSPQ